MNHEQLVSALFPNGEPSDYKDYTLILPLTAVQVMQQAQDIVASDRHKVQPVATTDGRYLVSADIIPELGQGGIFEPALPHFDSQALEGVEVMPWTDGVALLPVPEMDDV